MSTRLITAAAACLALLSGPALALPAQASLPGYRLATASADGVNRSVVRWNPCQPITVKVNLGALPSPLRPAGLKDTKTALRRVSVATGHTFSYLGQTREVPRTATVRGQSADIVVAWTTPAKTDYPVSGNLFGHGGELDTTAAQPTLDGGVRYFGPWIMRGFVVLDTPQIIRDRAKRSGAGVSQVNMLLHELGHAVGLEHVANRSQLMNPYLTGKSPAGYGAGDLAGLRKVGQAAGCITLPGPDPVPLDPTDPPVTSTIEITIG